MRIYLSLVFILSLCFSLSAQKNKKARISPEDWSTIHTLEDTLGVLSYAVINDSFPEERFAACRQMIPILVKALKHDHSFKYPFERMRTVSIQYDPDSTFRIFTWQLYVDKDEYRYYGAIQLNTPDLQLFPLIDRSFELDQDPEQAELDHQKWYGSVYYNMKTVKHPDGDYHLLFGYDGNSFFERRKVIDVLRFVDGKPVFGAPVFVHKAENRPTLTKKRILLEYSADTSVKCNWDPAHDLIIFDHLISMANPYTEGFTQVPDGSYEAYKLDKGKWMHIEKVFNQVQETPVMPEPILDNKTKDIFGKGGR